MDPKDSLVRPSGTSEGEMNDRPTARLTDSSVVSVKDKHATPPPRYVLICRSIAENRYVVIFTTLLTIWALSGDDIKLWATNKPADVVFDGIVYLMIVVFTSEIILGSIGKEDYYMGFFFVLDVVSTFTLFLDLSWATDLVMQVFESIGSLVESDDEGDGGDVRNLRSSKTARVGAKAGRVVRVLRLVRILKLYKAYYDEQARRRAEAEMRDQNPGQEDEWEDDGQEEPEPENNAESRVGKKLSELTTRRVIFLILTSLLVLPVLQSEEVTQCPASTSYASDEIYRSFFNYQDTSRDIMEDQEVYERSVLNFFYYHNWFARCEDTQCPAIYLGSTFWVGLRASEGDASVLDRLGQLAQLRSATVNSFESAAAAGGNLYDLDGMPPQITTLMASPWDTVCFQNGYKLTGLSLLKNELTYSNKDITYEVLCPEEDLRLREYQQDIPQLLTDEAANNWTFVMYSDLRPYTQEEARFNILVTCFVCVLLMVASLQFSHDANTLILNPVENMVRRVEAIRDNPLVAMKMADDEFKAEEKAKARLNKNKKEQAKKCVSDFLRCGFCCRRQVQEPMETVILEKTIIKLGSLLALGFGEAGANIIGQNMQGDGSGVNAMVDGVRVECVIGVARVRHFSTATEVLQANIMRFVNQIAEIVHGVVTEYHGAPNKNYGEKFLIIWRTKELDWSSAVIPKKVQDKKKDDDKKKADDKKKDDKQKDDKKKGDKKDGKEGEDDKEDDNDSPEAKQAKYLERAIWQKKRVAELSVCAFCKILAAIHRSPMLATYRGHPGLQFLLGSSCRVNMSFGLHSGWAIEGAVGSEFKIDASYLSPNVSIATSVENATTIYNVPIIVAQSVASLCGGDIFEKFRLIDHVMIRGSTSPMELFSMDLNYMGLSVDTSPPLKINWTSRQRFNARQRMEIEKAKKWADDLQVVTLLNSDPNFTAMRRLYTVEFNQLYKMGFQNYKWGEWQVAKRMLACTKTMLGTVDGPSVALLEFMERRKFEADKEWTGVRGLDA